MRMASSKEAGEIGHGACDPARIKDRYRGVGRAASDPRRTSNAKLFWRADLRKLYGCSRRHVLPWLSPSFGN